MAPALLVIWLLASPASISVGGAPPSGQSAPPPPIPTTYRFEKDVAVEIIEDRNRDGRPDAWRGYDRGHIIRLELDTNFDGKADWREKWDPRPGPPGEHQLQHIDGRWRFVPNGYLHDSLHGKAPYAVRYTGHAEKLVEGRWTDTFIDTQNHEHLDDNDIGPREPPVRWAITYRYKDGKPVEAADPRSNHHITWANGVPQREASEGIVADGEKHSSVETYRDGVPALREYFVAGKPTYRITFTAGVPRWEAFRDGAWTGDYEDLGRDAEGRLTSRDVYRGGVRAIQEQLDPQSGKVQFRFTARPDGGSINERADNAGNITTREQYGPAAWPRTMERLVDGKWTGDFTDTNSGHTEIYKDGRLVHFDQGNASISPEWMRIFDSPDPDHEQWSDRKHVRRWHTFKYEPGRMRRMIREARDLDGDGKADVAADYEKLTIEQPPGPKQGAQQ
jgi:hypothetical protein